MGGVGPSPRRILPIWELVRQSIPRCIAGSTKAAFEGSFAASTITLVIGKALGGPTSPNIDQIAHAFARKFAWRIQPNGATAQNLLGLSTQLRKQQPNLRIHLPSCLLVSQHPVRLSEANPEAPLCLDALALE